MNSRTNAGKIFFVTADYATINQILKYLGDEDLISIKKTCVKLNAAVKSNYARPLFLNLLVSREETVKRFYRPQDEKAQQEDTVENIRSLPMDDVISFHRRVVQYDHLAEVKKVVSTVHVVYQRLACIKLQKYFFLCSVYLR